jgi:hypothetical protein
VSPSAPLRPNDNATLYLAVRGVRYTSIETEAALELFGYGSHLSFNLLDGSGILYFGAFESLPAREIAFRLNLLLQTLDHAHTNFETITSKAFSPGEVERSKAQWAKVAVEVLVSPEVDRDRLARAVADSTRGLFQVPWNLITQDDMDKFVRAARAKFEDL